MPILAEQFVKEAAKEINGLPHKQFSSDFEVHPVGSIVATTLSLMAETVQGDFVSVGGNSPDQKLHRADFDVLAFSDGKRPPFFLLGRKGAIETIRRRVHTLFHPSVWTGDEGVIFYPDSNRTDLTLFKLDNKGRLMLVTGQTGSEHFNLDQIHTYGDGTEQTCTVGFLGFVRATPDGRQLAGMNVFLPQDI